MNKPIKPLDNSDICLDQLGNVGIIGGINAGVAQFYVFDKDGGTDQPADVALDTLSRAPLASIPPSRRANLADAQWTELGYE